MVYKDTLILIVFPFIPPESKMVKWYWTPIVGVPFLLRNIINIQRCGGKQIYLYHWQELAAVKELCCLVNNDPRIQNKTKFISAPKDLVNLLQSRKKILILNASTLHNRLDILNAISLLTQDSIIDKEEEKDLVGLENLLVQLEKYDDSSDYFSDKIIVMKDQKKPLCASNESIRIKYLSGIKITKKSDFHKEHVRILQSGGLETDSMINRLFSRSVSRLITRLVIHMPITPNQVTVISFLFGLISTWFFIQGVYWMTLLGSVILVISTWIDGVDGELARLTFRESKVGAKMDITLDCLVNFMVFFSIGMGLTRASGDNLYTILGIFSVFGGIISFVFMNALISESKSPEISDSISMNKGRNIQDKIVNRDFIFILFLLALIDKTEIFMWIATIGANLFAIYSVYARYFDK